MSKKKHPLEIQLRKEYRLENGTTFHKFPNYQGSVWTILDPNMACFQENGLYLYIVVKLSDLQNSKRILYPKMGHATRPVQITIGETSHNRYDLRDVTIILDVITVDQEILNKHQTDTVVKLEEKVRKELGFIRNEEYNGIEWWLNKSAFQLIEEMKVYLFGSKAKDTFQPRKRQWDAINKIVNAIQMGYNQFLLGALMRFGKNFTVLWALSDVLKNKHTKRILYWTFKPGVFVSLEKDINNHIKFQDYEFRLLKDTKSLEDLPTNVIVAASRQLVENKSNYPLLNEVLSQPWDAIVVDECHAGIETEKGQNVLDFFKDMGCPIIYMSGTPQKQIGKMEFCEQNTYLYDETHQLQDKKSGVWPDAIILETFLIKLSNENFEEVKKFIGNDGLFNFTKFFTYDPNVGRFTYEQDIKDFIRDFWGLNPLTRSKRNFFGGYDHMFILVPSDSKMITQLAKILQGILGYEYAVLDATGKFNRSKLTQAIAKGKKTVTLSCKMLIEGETVPEWVCTVNMSDTPSLFKYRQFCFRPTSPNVKNPNKRAFFYDLNPETHFNMTYDRFKSDGITSSEAENLTREYYENHNIFYGETTIKWLEIDFESLKKDSIRSRNLINSIKYHIQWGNILAMKALKNSISEVDITIEYGDEYLKLNDNDMEGGKTSKLSSNQNNNNQTKNEIEKELEEIKDKLATVLSRFPYVMFLEKNSMEKISVESIIQTFTDEVFEGAFGMKKSLFSKVWKMNDFIDQDEVNFYFRNLVNCGF